MKYLGNVKVTLLKEKQEYKELFSPLSESEYEDLRESIREAGILNDLLLEKTEEGYIILSGHHRKAVALELGMEEVPCSLAETRSETLEALFDNASRRQMTEAERKEKVKEKEKVQDRIYEESLIPELHALYKEGKIDRRSVDEFLREDLDLQKSIFYSLSVERHVVPQELLEEHEHEIESIEARHNEDLNDLRKKLSEAEAEKKKAEEALEQNGKKLEEIRKRAKNTLCHVREEQGTDHKRGEKRVREGARRPREGKGDPRGGHEGEAGRDSGAQRGDRDPEEQDIRLRLPSRPLEARNRPGERDIRQEHRLLFESRPDRDPAPGDLGIRRVPGPVLRMSHVGRRCL